MKLTRAHGLTDEDEDDARAQRGRVAIDRAEYLVEKFFADGQDAALVVEFVKVADDVLFGGRHFDGLHRAEEFADEASHLAASLTRCAAIMFDAAGCEVGDDADDDQRNQRHDRHRRVDLGHQDDGYRDDDQPDHDVVDQNHEERNLVHVGFEAADGFACRVGQRRCARAAQDVLQQILAQQGGHVREDGHIGIIKAVAGDDASDPGGGEEGDDCPDAKGQLRFACHHVEEGFDDERGRDLPAKADERYADEVNEPQPRAEANHLPDDLPCGQCGDFLIEGCFHDKFLFNHEGSRSVTKVGTVLGFPL